MENDTPTLQNVAKTMQTVDSISKNIANTVQMNDQNSKTLQIPCRW